MSQNKQTVVDSTVCLSMTDSEIHTVVLPVAGFCGTRSDELLMTAERALQLLLSQLGSLTKEWKVSLNQELASRHQSLLSFLRPCVTWQGVLPTDVFASTTGTLMDAAFTALVDSILRMEDIAAVETRTNAVPTCRRIIELCFHIIILLGRCFGAARPDAGFAEEDSRLFRVQSVRSQG